MKIKDFLAAGFDSIKEPLKNYKPVIKGCIMVFLGMFLTRYDIGIGRLTVNFIFGTFAYLFLSLSFLLLYRKILNPHENYERNVTRTIVLFIILNLLGISLIVIGIILYNLSIFNILVYIICLGILLISFLIALKKENNPYLSKIILALIFTGGLIFGAGLNNLIIPLYIYYMVITLSFVQISREVSKLISENKGIKQMKEWRSMKDIKSKSRTLILDPDELKYIKHALCFQIIALVFFILVEFAGIVNYIYFLYYMTIGLIFLGIAIYFNIKSIRTTQFHEKVNNMLKWTIIFQFLAFLAAS